MSEVAKFFRAISIFLLLLTISCSPSTNKINSVSLTISAASSLKEVMGELQELYKQQKPTVKIIYNFGSSGSLQQQIDQGAEVDIFISAANHQMDVLQAKGLLIDETRKNILSNKVVLIVPKNYLNVLSFDDLASDRIKTIALGEPKSVPVGRYAQEMLTHIKIFNLVKSKLISAKDTRQVLSYVETRNVDAGIVYFTDAKISNNVKIVATAPASYHSPIVYPVAVLKTSDNLAEAKEFVNFISSKAVSRVYSKYGFIQLANH